MHHNSGTTDLILIQKGGRIALLFERRPARKSHWQSEISWYLNVYFW